MRPQRRSSSTATRRRPYRRSRPGGSRSTATCPSFSPYRTLPSTRHTRNSRGVSGRSPSKARLLLPSLGHRRRRGHAADELWKLDRELVDRPAAAFVNLGTEGPGLEVLDSATLDEKDLPGQRAGLSCQIGDEGRHVGGVPGVEHL